MFAAILAAALAAGVAGMLTGVEMYEQTRLHTVAQQIAGVSAVIWKRRIAKYEKCAANPPVEGCAPTTPTEIATAALPYACIGHQDYPQDQPTFTPSQWPLLSGADPVEIVVQQKIVCPGLLAGEVSQTVTATIPLNGN